MARWLVTGGAGFIGSHIVDALIQRGEKVRVLDNFISGKKENLSHVESEIELIRGDIREQKDLTRAVRNVDYVLHQASLRSVPASLLDPAAYADVNVGGTVNLLWASLRARVKRVVLASSSSVYGTSKKYPQSPADPVNPISPYAASKLSMEHFARVFSETMGLSTASLRYFNVFGPRQDSRSKYAVVIPIFMEAAYHNRPLPLDGDGRQSRDFAYVSNVVHANLLAATRSAAHGGVFNVACGASSSLLDYIALLKKLSGNKLKVVHHPSRLGDVKKTWADISLTRKKLGYKPRVSFADGVKLTWKYFLSQKA